MVQMLFGGISHGDELKTSSVKTVEDLNTVIWEMALNQEEERFVNVLGTNDSEEFRRTIGKSMWMDCAHEYHYRYWEKTPRLVFQLELKEGMRLLAALKNAKLASRLQAPERSALKDLQKKIEILKMPGLTRKEKVMMLLDDVYGNCKCSDRIPAKKKQGYFAAFVLHKRGDVGTMAEYLQVMLSALEIPCHTFSYGVAFNMVQLENGNWYNVFPGKDFYTEVNSWLKETSPDFPKTPEVCDVTIKTFTSADKFWKAADKAFAAGERFMGAKIKKYPGAKKFKEAYNEHFAAGGAVIPGKMYLPSAAGKTRYVCVTFSEGEGESIVDDVEENPFSIENEVNKVKAKAKNKFRKVFQK